MNQITRISENIASLQKVQLALNELEGKHWRDKEVWSIALTVRNSFHDFEQKWRELVKGNPFFYFCIPTGGFFLSGSGVYNHNASESDEITQQKMLAGWQQLNQQIPNLVAQMQESRNNLLSLQNQNGYIAAFQEFDRLRGKLSLIFSTNKNSALSPHQELQEWLLELILVLKTHGLDGRFNPNFDDTSKTLAERVERREVALKHIVDSLATNPTEHLPKGGPNVTNNFGDNTTIGVQNNGTANDIRDILVKVKQLSKNYPSVSENIEQLTAEIAAVDLEPEAKEIAIDAICTVSQELAKPVDQQKGWKVKENLEKLTKVIESAAALGVATTKLEPYITQLIRSIHQHFPTIPLT